MILAKNNSPANILKRNGDLKGTITKFLFRLTGIIILILLWEIAIRLYLLLSRSEQFAGFLPGNAFKSLLLLSTQAFFWQSIFASLFRIFLGLFIATSIGIPGGLLTGASKRLYEITNFPIHFIRMISPISWMPIALIFLPGFESAIVFLLTMSTIWPILLNTNHGVRDVNQDWINMALNQGATRQQLLFRVIFPASVPYILSGLRLAVGVAWIVLVPAEFLGISSGLGYLINDARNTFAYDQLMAVVITIGIIGYSIDFLFNLILKRFDWRKKS